MTPERWRAVDAVLQGALERPPAARGAFLAEACADDPALRAEVESLLGAGADPGFLASTPGGAAPGPAPIGRLLPAVAERYAVERELGRGGMATVYLARDLRHRRPVAVKVLRPDLAARVGAARFLREIELVANLAHPHVLPLFDSGEADGCSTTSCPTCPGGRCATASGAAGRSRWATRCASRARWPRRSPTRTGGAWCTAT
jgi:serine/threonine-protein kinase